MVTYLCRPVQFSSVQLFIISNDNYSQMANEFRKISHFPEFNSIATRLTRDIKSCMWRTRYSSNQFCSSENNTFTTPMQMNGEEMAFHLINSNGWSRSRMIEQLLSLLVHILHLNTSHALYSVHHMTSVLLVACSWVVCVILCIIHVCYQNIN